MSQPKRVKFPHCCEPIWTTYLDLKGKPRFPNCALVADAPLLRCAVSSRGDELHLGVYLKRILVAVTRLPKFGFRVQGLGLTISNSKHLICVVFDLGDTVVPKIK